MSSLDGSCVIYLVLERVGGLVSANPLQASPAHDIRDADAHHAENLNDSVSVVVRSDPILFEERNPNSIVLLIGKAS